MVVHLVANQSTRVRFPYPAQKKSDTLLFNNLMTGTENNNSKGWPTVFIVFGATGDLMTKKIAPALYSLFKANQLPKLLTIIGSARREFSNDEFREYVKKILIDKGASDDETIKTFLSHFEYHKAEFTNPADYQSLAEKLGKIDGVWQACSNKLFYIAVPPQSYELLFTQLSSSGLTLPCGPDEGWTRVIVEKPFGDDYETAEKIDQMLWKLFKEEQIYRIDHYLAKEMLQNILVFRFTNNLLEKVWTNSEIESIDIKLFETLGVEKRGAFYEKVGALKDVGQNHILQLLSLVTMENPISLEAEKVRVTRSKVLQFLPDLSEEDIVKNTKRYQYKGYREIEDVDKSSTVETYFDINFSLTHPRWKDVKIRARSGKRMAESRKEIVITFKHLDNCLCPIDGQHVQNRVIFRFAPEEEIVIEFWSKKPGYAMEIQQADFKFTYQTEKSSMQYTDEYQKLLLDCIDGNQLLFVSTSEVAAMWKFIDPIVKVWKNNLVPLQEYEPDTTPE